MLNKLNAVSVFFQKVCVAVCISAWVLFSHAETLDSSAKKTIGTITSLEAGDVACYIYLKDEQGVEFGEMGDFTFCEDPSALVGKRVKLTYGIVKVLADECQGNPDCGKFQEELVVTDVAVLNGAAAH